MSYSLAIREAGRPWPVDFAGLLLLVGAAVSTGSFCLLAQLLRSGALWFGRTLSGGILSLAQRRFPARFQFGYEKLQRCCDLLLGVMLVAGAAWLIAIGPSVAHLSLRQSPLLPAVAATANLAWLLWTWRQRMSSRTVHAVALVAQGLMTLGALSVDGHFWAHCDLLAGVLIAAIAFYQGLRNASDAVRELVDSPVQPDDLSTVLDAVLAAGIQREEISNLRARQVGGRLFLELQMKPLSGRSIEQLRARLERVAQAATRAVPRLDLSFKLPQAEGPVA